MRGPLGGLFTLPWFDRASMYFLRRWYLPLSRLWAVADEAHGSIASFVKVAQLELGTRQTERLSKVLFHFEVSRARVNAIDAAWQEAFFGAQNAALGDLAAIEKARKKAQQSHNIRRRDLRFLLSFKPPDFAL